MIVYLLSILISTSFSQGISGDPIVLQAIKQNIPICRNGNPRNCIKPIIAPGSSIKAIEIKILSAEQVSFTTYNENGVPADLEKDYSLKIIGDQEKSLIDVNLEVNAFASDNFLQLACKKNDNAACTYLGQRLLDKFKIKEATKILKSKCDTAYIPACITLFNHPRLEKDSVLRKYTLSKLCSLKQYEFCNILGADLILLSKGHELISELIESCKNGYSLGCLLSSQVFITESPQEGLKGLRIGCDQKDGQDICFLAASIYHQINKISEANELFKISCQRGYALACTNEPSKDINQLFKDILKKRNLFHNLDFKLNPNIKIDSKPDKT